ncbi:DUF3169 family protein [Staphylococcus chromogenes]|uniref:DUF3169 family protein n=1 Tax=Staphylococcus chromogenes TaxID=46126 RepID=UPI00118D44F7|nr:DUF3169 family protein [Staphylococcus chromogenes]QDW90592.1 DUF3169 family protein [Staphylococcus chromogenes]
MKIGRYLLWAFIGGICGYLFAYVLDITHGFRTLTEFKITDSTTIHLIGIISLILVCGLILVAFYTQKKTLKYKKQLDRHIEDDQADGIETRASLSFLNVSLIIYATYFVTFLLFFIFVVGKVDVGYLAYPTIIFLLVVLSGIPYGFFVRRYEPRFPKLGEKQYTEKTLAIMDEGERHITLVSMYKIYHMNLSLVMSAILVLGFFSIQSGSHQFLGMAILIVLFIYNAFGYLFKVRRHYK